MRFKSKSVLLAFVAVFAMSAVAVSAASAAAPEFKPVPAKKKFTSTGGSVTWTSSAWKDTCSKGSATTGEVTGAKTLGKIKMTLSGCKQEDGGKVCPLKSTNTSIAEQIVMEGLKGELGTAKTTEAASGVVLALEPETGKKFTTLAANECWAETAVDGSIGAEVQSVGKKQLTSDFVFSASSPGGSKAKIKGFDEKGGWFEFEYAGKEFAWETTDAVTFEEALEVT